MTLRSDRGCGRMFDSQMFDSPGCSMAGCSIALVKRGDATAPAPGELIDTSARPACGAASLSRQAHRSLGFAHLVSERRGCVRAGQGTGHYGGPRPRDRPGTPARTASLKSQLSAELRTRARGRRRTEAEIRAFVSAAGTVGLHQVVIPAGALAPGRRAVPIYICGTVTRCARWSVTSGERRPDESVEARLRARAVHHGPPGWYGTNG